MYMVNHSPLTIVYMHICSKEEKKAVESQIKIHSNQNMYVVINYYRFTDSALSLNNIYQLILKKSQQNGHLALAVYHLSLYSFKIIVLLLNLLVLDKSKCGLHEFKF